MLKADWKDTDLLMTEFRAGNMEAFRQIYDINHLTLWQFANNFISNEEEAEDIVAESFIKIWERRHTFEDITNIRSFLFVITRNACLDHIKSTQRKAVSHKEFAYLVPKSEEYIQASMIKAELIQKVLDEMRNMPDAMKEIFRLMYVEGLSTAEIAKRLNITTETVRGQKARALKLVKKGFRKKGLMSFWGIFLSSILNSLIINQ